MKASIFAEPEFSLPNLPPQIELEKIEDGIYSEIVEIESPEAYDKVLDFLFGKRRTIYPEYVFPPPQQILIKFYVDEILIKDVEGMIKKFEVDPPFEFGTNLKFFLLGDVYNERALIVGAESLVSLMVVDERGRRYGYEGGFSTMKYQEACTPILNPHRSSSFCWIPRLVITTLSFREQERESTP